MQALRIYAGPRARIHLERNGLQAADVCTIAAAAGGPKGLILGPLDRFIFGPWLAASRQPVHLVGASIGAWRMAAACLDDPVAASVALEHDYIRQHYPLKPGQSRPEPEFVSQRFAQNLQAFYAQQVGRVVAHPRYALHIFTSRGRHVLRREHRLGTPLGYLGAFVSNSIRRRAMGAWLERVVFSSVGAELPFATDDYRTRALTLDQDNFHAVLQASCSIPFLLRAVHNIPGAPAGAYWDGGITDYHLHLRYKVAALAAREPCGGCASPAGARQQTPAAALVLYPHFQKAVIPGWLDKGLKWRHQATANLDDMVLLAPDPQWVRSLPNAKLPDRNDFVHYGNDLAARVRAWTSAAAASAQLADEFAAWLERPDMRRVQPL